MASTQQGNGGESQGGKEIGRASWSKEVLNIFIDLCNQHMERSKGKSGVTISQRLPWKKVEMELQKRTNLSWHKVKLKNKYDWMRSRWSLWKQLKGRETGLGWDHVKGTISASDEWWNLKIQENRKFETFRDKRIDPELEYKMDQLFGCSSVGEVFKFTLIGDRPQEHEKEGVYVLSQVDVDNACGPPLDHQDNMDETNDLNNCYMDSTWEEIWREDPTPTPTSRATQNDGGERRKGKRVLESDGLESYKSARTISIKKGGADAIICEKLDNLLETIKERNSAMINFLSAIDSSKHDAMEASKHSLTDALAKICALPDLEPGTPEFSCACMLIEDPQKRTILFGLPSDKAIVEWIKFMYGERKKS